MSKFLQNNYKFIIFDVKNGLVYRGSCRTLQIDIDGNGSADVSFSGRLDPVPQRKKIRRRKCSAKKTNKRRRPRNSKSSKRS